MQAHQRALKTLQRKIYCCLPECDKPAIAMSTEAYFHFIKKSEFAGMLADDCLQMPRAKKLRYIYIHDHPMFPVGNELKPTAGCNEHVHKLNRVLLEPTSNRICSLCRANPARAGNYTVVVGDHEEQRMYMACGSCNKLKKQDGGVGEGERLFIAGLRLEQVGYGFEALGQKPLYDSPDRDVSFSYMRDNTEFCYVVEVATGRTHDWPTDLNRYLRMAEKAREQMARTNTKVKLYIFFTVWTETSGSMCVDIVRQHVVRMIERNPRDTSKIPPVQLGLVNVPTSDVSYVKRLLEANVYGMEDPGSFVRTCVHALTGVPHPNVGEPQEVLLANRDTTPIFIPQMHKGRQVVKLVGGVEVHQTKRSPATPEVLPCSTQYNLAPFDLHIGESRGNRGNHGTKMQKCLPRHIRDNEMRLPALIEFPPETPMNPRFRLTGDPMYTTDVGRLNQL